MVQLSEQKRGLGLNSVDNPYSRLPQHRLSCAAVQGDHTGFVLLLWGILNLVYLLKVGFKYFCFLEIRVKLLWMGLALQILL